MNRGRFSRACLPNHYNYLPSLDNHFRLLNMLIQLKELQIVEVKVLKLELDDRVLDL